MMTPKQKQIALVVAVTIGIFIAYKLYQTYNMKATTTAPASIEASVEQKSDSLGEPAISTGLPETINNTPSSIKNDKSM